MAALFPEDRFVVDVLRLFHRGAGGRESWAQEEILAQINSEWPWSNLYFRHRWRSTEEQLESVEAVLDSLAELGLIAEDRDREESSGFRRWRVAQSWQPGEQAGGRNDGGDVPRGTTEGDEGDGDGGGLQESLSHPVLFALDHEDFDRLVDGLFAGDSA